MLMARKIEMNSPQDEFNKWARELQVSSRCDYTDFEFREKCKRIEEAKYAMMNPRVSTPSEQLESLKTDQGNIFSGIKSLLNIF